MPRLRPVIALLLGALLLAAVPIADGARTADPPWTGTWASPEWGTMRLTQTGSSVEGTYTHDQGHIKGTVSGNVLTGRWDEAPTRTGPSDAGEVILTRSGKSFTGQWNYDGDKTLRTDWSGTCTSGPCLGEATTKPTCTRTYVVEPGGARIHANVKNTELTAKQIAAVLDREKGKYEGWDYTPIGKVTRKVNCAGFVMLKLFARQMVDANVDPDQFFRAIVKPFGSKRISRATARAGDVVVWRVGGVVKHVAFVESGGVRPTILTKDQNERLYRMKLAIDPRGEEPLAVAHGSIEFWQIDRSKVKIAVVDGEDCGK